MFSSYRSGFSVFQCLWIMLIDKWLSTNLTFEMMAIECLWFSILLECLPHSSTCYSKSHPSTPRAPWLSFCKYWVSLNIPFNWTCFLDKHIFIALCWGISVVGNILLELLGRLILTWLILNNCFNSFSLITVV